MTKKPKTLAPRGKELRSQLWFDNPDNPGMTALYLERYLNYGLTGPELRSGKPIIGIAQTGSDLSPCNRHHLELAKRVRDGIRDAGGIAFEFPCHPIQETGKRPTAALDRNLAYLSLVEVLYGYPLDGVVLLTGCDKTTPALIMAAATVNIPAIVLSGGPMLNGWWKGVRAGSGTAVWKAREELAAGRIDDQEFLDIATAQRAVGRPLQHHGHRLDHERARRSARHVAARLRRDPGAVPRARADRLRHRRARGRDRARGSAAVRHPHAQGVREHHRRQFGDRRLDQRADPHQRHRAPHRREAHDPGLGEDTATTCRCWSTCSRPGFYLGEEYFRAGGLPAVMNELLKAKRIHADALTINGKTMGENVKRAKVADADVIKPYNKPMKKQAGFKVLNGNLFDSAIMKTSVISDDFRKRFLSDPKDRNAFEGRAVVFDGPEDYHHRIDDPSLKIDDRTILFMRGAGAIGYPGSAEVVNMQPPAALIKKGITALPCIGDGRQSGTSGSPSILNASPEAAAGGGLALLEDRRPRADRSQQGHGEYSDLEGRAGEAPQGFGKGRRLQVSGAPDAVAGNPARPGRSARRRHGAEARGEISARGADERAEG